MRHCLRISDALAESARPDSNPATVVFVIVPVDRDMATTVTRQRRRPFSFLHRFLLGRDRSSPAQKSREQLADGVQATQGEWPFWTWFIDNPRPSQSSQAKDQC